MSEEATVTDILKTAEAGHAFGPHNVSCGDYLFARSIYARRHTGQLA